MSIELLVAQGFSQSCNPVMMSATDLQHFCTCDFDFYCVPAHDSRHFLLQVYSPLKLKFSCLSHMLVLWLVHTPMVQGNQCLN